MRRKSASYTLMFLARISYNNQKRAEGKIRLDDNWYKKEHEKHYVLK